MRDPHLLPLPDELVDRVLGSLSPNDLASCCRVGTALLARARPALYRNCVLEIAHKRWPLRSWQWVTSLEQHPHLAAHVRQVRLAHATSAGPSWGPPHTSLFSVFERVLAPLTDLRHLDGLWGAFLSPVHPFPFFDTLVSLRAIDLDDDGWGVVLCLPKLRHLAASVPSSAPSLAHDAPRPACRLDTLVIDYTAPDAALDTIDALLQSSQSTLSTLSLSLDAHFATLRLAHLPRVTTLCVPGPPNRAWDVHLARLMGLCPALHCLVFACLPGTTLPFDVDEALHDNPALPEGYRIWSQYRDELLERCHQLGIRVAETHTSHRWPVPSLFGP